MEKATILIIEDNQFQGKTTKGILEKAGYLVLWEKTGLSGFKTARVEKPDLVLLDVVLPDKDGHEICRFIKMNEAIHDIPVIMLTAKGKVEDKVKGLNIGADDYLPKPFDEMELLARINAFLRIKRLQDALKRKHDQLEKLLRKVETMAITDIGTGLFNRRHFLVNLDKEFTRAKRYNSPLSCIMIDIDHFKKVNDTYGHLVGDSAIEEIGSLIRDNFRNLEISARYGGDEFVILLPETDLEGAEKPALRFLEQIRAHRFKGIADDNLITVSMGITAIPDSEIVSKEDLIRGADYALYKAKKADRNRVEMSTGSEVLNAEIPKSV